MRTYKVLIIKCKTLEVVREKFFELQTPRIEEAIAIAHKEIPLGKNMFIGVEAISTKSIKHES